MLLNYYYTINDQQTEGETTRFYVTLNKDCEIYKGHFPGMPVTPGVCNIQMIKECIEQLTGKRLLLEYIAQCKLTTLITPQQYPELQICIHLSEQNDSQVKTKATIGQNEEEYLTFKGEYKILNELTTSI
ncbi:MAG: beta-hydroxyacyl-ACP dehydratase [Tannerella sp.]|jgi:3-hydroxyacyl-[acyl-carrier-protein] dehydratase|nr:beta-hydroxyacyl-ACP dehydratase [Tannerella sp.]